MKTAQFYIVLVTAPNLKTARKLAKAALELRLVACANIVPRVESHYWWQGKIESAAEVLLILKTTAAQSRGFGRGRAEAASIRYARVSGAADRAREPPLSRLVARRMRASEEIFPPRVRLHLRVPDSGSRFDCVSSANLIPVLLLILLSTATLSVLGFVLVAIHWRRQQPSRRAGRRIPVEEGTDPAEPVSTPLLMPPCPGTWLAIRSRNLQVVQLALGVNNPRPCRFIRGLAEEHKLFIAPPVHGWILVTGSGLPDLTDDIDALFRFIASLSRKLGHVQFFSASRILGYHAWVRAESGRVDRAYAWAGRTLWNQGPRSRGEVELGLSSFQYFETSETPLFGQADAIAANVERLPALAARWSIDPSTIDERTLEQTCGIAGELGRLY